MATPDTAVYPDTTIELTFSACSQVYLNDVCEELSIKPSEIKSLYIKYCTLYITLNDGRELEYETGAEFAEVDTKYPSHILVYRDREILSRADEYAGHIDVPAHPTKPYAYVLSEYQCDEANDGYVPIFVGRSHSMCEAEAKNRNLVDFRIDMVDRPFI